MTGHAAGLAAARARASGALDPLQGDARQYHERLSRAHAWRPQGPVDSWVRARLGGDPALRLSYLGWMSAGFRAADAVRLALDLRSAPRPGPSELGGAALALARGGLRP